MKNGIKVVAIGRGISYTKELVDGFLKRYDELPVRELFLVEQDAKEELDEMTSVAMKMVEESGYPMAIRSSMDRRTALRNADFVTTQFSLEKTITELDQKIPLTYGMLGQETAFAVMTALRTVPRIYSIIRDMKELCPDAWLINLTNPNGIVSEAVFRYADFERYLGVCKIPYDLTNSFSKRLSAKRKDVIPYFAGLNHMSYVLNVYHKGKDQLQYILDDMNHRQAELSKSDAANWALNFINQLGVYPNPYHSFYYNYEEMLELYKGTYNVDSAIQDIDQVDACLFEKHISLENNNDKTDLVKNQESLDFSAACNVIDSIYNDRRDYHVVNTINDGYITDLPDGCAIEITCRITKHGPIPVYIGRLPLEVKGLIRNVKSFEEVLVDAIYERDLEKAKLALQIHPLTRSIYKAGLCFDELVQAERQYLDYYFEE